jgi:hypothetical protein
MKSLFARRPSPALIVAIVALVCALTGTAWAALGKNSVGSKQLKKNAVTSAKIKKEAVTANKVKKHSLTGKNINLKKLGTVPSATNAVNATNAGTAGALTPLEAVHYVGTPGQPQFVEAANLDFKEIEEEAGLKGVSLRKVGFYKDHEGIVHLEGLAEANGTGGSEFLVIFSLPQGFRPATGTALTFPNVEGEQIIAVVGSGVSYAGHDYSGDIVLVGGGTNNAVSLNGITFRAEG